MVFKKLSSHVNCFQKNKNFVHYQKISSHVNGFQKNKKVFKNNLLCALLSKFLLYWQVFITKFLLSCFWVLKIFLLVVNLPYKIFCHVEFTKL